MRKSILYIAMSLDGYIADINNSVSWISGDDSDVNHPGTYDNFIKGVDAIILGNTTYSQIINELSPEYWVYSGMQSYVITHKSIDNLKNEKSLNPVLKDEDISFYNVRPSTLVKKLKEEDGKDIWVCGGASIVHELIENTLIDRFHISVIPVLLGSGVRLFNNFNDKINLKLLSTVKYNGIIDLVYENK